MKSINYPQWMTKSIVQIVVIGFLAFCGPGMFNAMSGLGKAGSDDNTVAAVANGCLYFAFSFVGYFSGAIFKMIGPRLCFVFGGLCYAVYSICVFYTTDERYWLAAIGGLVLGCGAGVFWTAQSTLMMAYATNKEKGMYTAIFWAIFNAGGVIGGFMSAAITWSQYNETVYPIGGGSLNEAGYWAFIGIMLTGAVVSAVALVPTAQVKRSDGTSVVWDSPMGAVEEIKIALRAIKDPFVVRMFVYFLFSNWFYQYEFNYLNGMFFNARSRGINSGIYWVSQMIGAQIMAKLCDRKSWTVTTRAWSGFYCNILFLVISWTLAFATQYGACNGNTDKYTLGDKQDPDSSSLWVSWFPPMRDGESNGCQWLEDMHNQIDDWDFYRCIPEKVNPKMPRFASCLMDMAYTKDAKLCDQTLGCDGVVVTAPQPLNYASQSVLPIVCFIFMGMSDAMFQCFAYWMMGTMAGSSISDGAKYAAAYKGIQSAGACISWFTDLPAGFLYRYQSYLCIALGGVAVIGSWLAIPVMVRHVQARDAGAASADSLSSSE